MVEVEGGREVVGVAVVEVEEKAVVVVGARVVERRGGRGRRMGGRFGHVHRHPRLVVDVAAVVAADSAPLLRSSLGPYGAKAVASRPRAARTHGCATTGTLQTAHASVRNKLNEWGGGGMERGGKSKKMVIITWRIIKRAIPGGKKVLCNEAQEKKSFKL